MKKYTLAFVASLLTIFGSCISPEEKFDKKVGQKPVWSKSSIDSVLNSFGTVKYDELPKSYIEFAQLKKHPSVYKNKTWYRIVKDDAYKFLVGEFRVKNFLPKDKYYNQQDTQYLLIDKRVLHCFNELQLLLKSKGYDPNAFKVYNGFRHPMYNDLKGGAPHSRHLHGEAIDIKVKDINKNGVADQNDKKIVIDLLEKKVIGSKGGIGKYVGTMSIHFDVRGWRARWNSYSRSEGSK